MKGYASVSYLPEGVLGGPGAPISNVTTVRERDQRGPVLSDDRSKAGDVEKELRRTLSSGRRPWQLEVLSQAFGSDDVLRLGFLSRLPQGQEAWGSVLASLRLSCCNRAAIKHSPASFSSWPGAGQAARFCELIHSHGFLLPHRLAIPWGSALILVASWDLRSELALRLLFLPRATGQSTSHRRPSPGMGRESPPLDGWSCKLTVSRVGDRACDQFRALLQPCKECV